MVIKLRTYYIFKINKYFSYVYKNKPYKIYKTIEEIYHVKKYDMVLTYKIYEQVAVTFDKTKLNEYLTKTYEVNNFYYKHNNTHVYSNEYEYTKLVVTNSNLKIKSNISNPIFFKDINNLYDDIFICDFINKDYFWLDKVIKKEKEIDDLVTK